MFPRSLSTGYQAPDPNMVGAPGMRRRLLQALPGSWGMNQVPSYGGGAPGNGAPGAGYGMAAPAAATPSLAPNGGVAAPYQAAMPGGAPPAAMVPGGGAGAGSGAGAGPGVTAARPEHQGQGQQAGDGGFKGNAEGYGTRMLKLINGLNPDLLAQLHNLGIDANNSDPNRVLLDHAGEYDQLNRQYQQAGNQMQTDLAARGLSDSSYGVAAQAGLEGSRLNGLTQLNRGVYSEADQRQQQARQMLLGELQQLEGLGANIADGKAQRRLQKYLAALQNNPWNALIGAAGQVGGSAAGAAVKGAMI